MACRAAVAAMTDEPLDAPVPPVVAKALVAAWADLSNVHKSQTVQAGPKRYDFADLAAVLDVVRPVLAKHGLAVLQPVTHLIGGPLVIETWVLHESGHMLRWVFEAPGDGSAQVVGSWITYGRRYSLNAALGIAAGGDDDGAAASVTPPVQDGGQRARDPLYEQAMDLFDRLGITEPAAVLATIGRILDREPVTWVRLSTAERGQVVAALRAQIDQELEADTGAVQRDIWDDLNDAN